MTMALEDIIYICKQYRDLGDAVAQQLEDIMDGEYIGEQNEAALVNIARFLKTVARLNVPEASELASDIDNTLEKKGAHPDFLMLDMQAREAFVYLQSQGFTPEKYEEAYKLLEYRNSK